MEKQPEDVRSVLAELLRLYDWRNELGRIERDFNHDKKQMKTWLNQYGREKKAAWEAAVRVLSVTRPTTEQAFEAWLDSAWPLWRQSRDSASSSVWLAQKKEAFFAGASSAT